MAKRSTKGPAPIPHSDTNWQARDAMHTLAAAERIKADPKLHAAAKAHAAAEAKALKKVAGRQSGKK